MEDSLYPGHWRLDWGLGNPNKTAALIAMLMIAVWSLAYIRKWGFWAALVLFTGFGTCLVLTQSRGGLVGIVIGGLVVLAWAPRPLPFRRSAAVIVACAALAIFAWVMNAESRYTQGLSGKDRSIDNRLLIWKQVPSMIHDAPNGWGLGRSGEAYMQWYQPIARGEGYRTLVNSHLTWLVELNWWGRIAYVLAWAAVLVLLWPHSDYRWFSIPWAIWIAFGICASFSSVAETVFLWVIPALALASVLATRYRKKIWPGSHLWLGGALGSILIIGGIFLFENQSVSSPSVYSPHEGIVILGPKASKIWIMAPNRSVLGEHYGHEIRRGFTAESICQQMGLGVTSGFKDIPKNQIVVFSGQVPSSFETLAPSQIILINPKPVSPSILQDLAAIPTVTVVVGEYSRNKDYWSEQARSCPNIKLQLIPGTEEYISNWMHEIVNAIKSQP